MKGNCSGIILAGGRSFRMQGNNKAFLKIGGIRLIDRNLLSLFNVNDPSDLHRAEQLLRSGP